MQGNIEHRGKDSWRIRIYLGRGPDGKKQYHRETVRGRKADAQRRLRELLVELDEGRLARPHDMTVGEFLDRWLRDFAELHLAQSAREVSQVVVRRYAKPALGHLRLQQLTPLHLQGLYSEMQRAGLKPATVRRYHGVLHRAFGHAIRWGMLARNPADGVDLPRLENSPVKVWTLEQLQQFLGVAKEHRLYALFLLVAYTGLRRGEALGLRWQDVDLDVPCLTVRQTLQRYSDFGQPKTRGSQRTIVFSAQVASALRQHRARQHEERLRAGQAYEDHGLVFCKKDGRPLTYDRFHDLVWRSLVHKAGVPWIPFHGLRHTHASLLLAAGCHPKVVQERLGHTSIQMTMDTYSHLMPNAQAEAAAKLDALMSGR